MSIADAATRRAAPRPWDTDWYVLRGLSATLASLVRDHVAPRSVVVDYGCGSMPYRAMVDARGATYVGADFGPGHDVEIGADGRVPLADGSVDTVLSVQVLEHVRSLDVYLGEAARILKERGVLILSTHGHWLYHPHPEDHRRWTRTGLVLDIEARGFKVDGIVAVAGPLATATVIRSTGYGVVLRRLPVVGRALAAAVAFASNLRAWVEDLATPSTIRRDNACVYVALCRKA